MMHAVSCVVCTETDMQGHWPQRQHAYRALHAGVYSYYILASNFCLKILPRLRARMHAADCICYSGSRTSDKLHSRVAEPTYADHV
jgi:hypothetical protein